VYVGHNEFELECILVNRFWTKEPETFGEYIKNLKILKGLSQKELAKKIGAEHSTIIDWEKGRYAPRRKTIIELINTLSSESWEAVKYDGVLTDR
jgi:DNA-binding XRE family transcriptional regulator